jgi:regulator of extracellular matrix RemA (YlzA/DUF370 family)
MTVVLSLLHGQLRKAGTLTRSVNVQTSQNDVLSDVEESCVVDRITTLKCNTVVASSTKYRKAKKIVMTQSSHPVASSEKCASLPNRLGLSSGVSHPFFSRSSVGKKLKDCGEVP